MLNPDLLPEQCMGCTVCALHCPVQCILMKEDAEGFAYPCVQLATCIDCGQCEQHCPSLQKPLNRRPLKEYALNHRANEMRKVSSSGGAFSALAESVLSREGVVFGARFDAQWQVVMDYTESREGLAAFRGSKYVEAVVGDSYQQAERFLKQGREVLYVSTPCRIAGLKAYLATDYDKLLTVDLGCYSVAPRKAWAKYLREHSTPPIRSVSFRDKSNGWRGYVLRIEDAAGTRFFRDNSYAYWRAFTNNLLTRPSCTRCHYKKGASGADLTISDFWRIQEYFPEMDDNQGTSFLAAYTRKGQNSIPFEQFQVAEITNQPSYLDWNRGLNGSRTPHPKRHEFLLGMDKNESFDTQLNHILYRPLWRRIANRVRRLLKR